MIDHEPDVGSLGAQVAKHSFLHLRLSHARALHSQLKADVKKQVGGEHSCTVRGRNTYCGMSRIDEVDPKTEAKHIWKRLGLHAEEQNQNQRDITKQYAVVENTFILTHAEETVQIFLLGQDSK